MELLKADAAKDLEPPRYYIPIWVPVESPSEKIQRAMEELAATAITMSLMLGVHEGVRACNPPAVTTPSSKRSPS